jgi:predicted TIM-barrel fold metal-dependent hydrolase
MVVSHAFWPHALASCGLAFRREHVYLLPDMYGVGMPGHTAWVELANTVSPDKVLFGSAYPIIDIPSLVRGYLSLPYRTEEIRNMVMYGNAARLLGIDT